MQINERKRPWQKQSQDRSNKDRFYQTSSWKRIREIHKSGTTLVNGFNLPNSMCINCYLIKGVLEPMHTVDHIKRIRSGSTQLEQEGLKYDLNNLQSLCKACNNTKTAIEGKEALINNLNNK